jgi:3-dehydroquinate dehydratase-1
VVGVITTPAELLLAARISHPPDLFEIRLDHFAKIDSNDLEKKLSSLRRPLIITARHPCEGGANDLSSKRRRELFLRFLPYADYIDVELRSVKMLRPVLDLARKRKVRRIISFHDLNSTPSVRSLSLKAFTAKCIDANVFKVATLTDNPAQLARLVQFAAKADVDLPLSVMGIGKLGRKSRRKLTRSILNYAHLGRARVAGQPSISEMRRWTLLVER